MAEKIKSEGTALRDHVEPSAEPAGAEVSFAKWLSDEIERAAEDAEESHVEARNTYGAGYDRGYVNALKAVEGRGVSDMYASLVEVVAATDAYDESPAADDRCIRAIEKCRAALSRSRGEG